MNLAAIVGGIGGFVLSGFNPAGAAAGAALGSKLSGSSDENALKDGLGALGLAYSPVGGAVSGAAAGASGIGVYGPMPASSMGASGAFTGAKEGFMAGIPSALGGKGLPISPSKALLGLTALSALGSGSKTATATEQFPGGERDPDYQPQTLVRPFYSRVTGKRYFTLEDMLRDEGKDVPDQPVGIASATQPNMLQVAMNNPQLLGSPSMPGMLMANEGGYIEGPGTGRSDSVKAGIFQNGQKVQEARLSDGEFVMTRKAVDNAGGGDREKGAARMYALISDLENKRVA